MAKKNDSWVVIVECVVRKQVCAEPCTEDQARQHPFEYSVQETEISMSDWTVKSVRANE